MSDTERISPYNNEHNIKHRSDENKVKYQLGIISWSNTKFSKLTS